MNCKNPEVCFASKLQDMCAMIALALWLPMMVGVMATTNIIVRTILIALVGVPMIVGFFCSFFIPYQD